MWAWRAPRFLELQWAWHYRALGASSSNSRGPGLRRDEPRELCAPSGGTFGFASEEAACSAWVPGAFHFLEDPCLPAALAGGLCSAGYVHSCIPTALTLSSAWQILNETGWKALQY